jgi:hypothetical protein
MYYIYLIECFLQKFNNQQLIKTLKWLSNQIGHEIESNWFNANYSYLKHFLRKNGNPDFVEIDNLVPREYEYIQLEWNVMENQKFRKINI